MDNNNNNVDEFITLDKLTQSQNLIDCYQIQVDDNNICNPVLIGRYPEIPLAVNTSIKYNGYLLHVVTYLLTKEEIDDGLFKIIGVNVFKNNDKNSLYSLDLIFNTEHKLYEIILNNHIENATITVEKLEIFPPRDALIEFIVTKVFEGPLKQILIL